MHDLLHAYASEIAMADHDPAPADAARRLFDYYLHSAALANQLLTPHRVRVPLTGDHDAGRDFADAAAAKRWLTVEEPNLIAMSRLDDPDLDEHRWQLAYVLRDYFYLTRQLDGWLETHEHALHAAMRSGNAWAEGLTRNNLGMVMTALGRLTDAEPHFTAAGKIFERLGDQMGTSNSLANTASILRRRGDPAGALAHLRTALVQYREMGSANHVGITLRSMANALLQLGQADEAVRCAQEAVDLATWLEFPLDIAQADNILGAAHRQLGQLTLAEIAYQQALEMSRRCESDFEQAWARRGLGAVALAAGRPGDALRHWQAALVLYRDVGSTLADDVAADIHHVKAAQESPA